MSETVQVTVAPIPKKANWSSELSRYVNRIQKGFASGEIVFDWTHMSCAMFVSGAVEAMTGQDFYEPFKEVDSAMSAARTLSKLGFRSIEGYIASKAPDRSLVMIQRGDVVLVQGLSEEGDGLVCGLADPPFFWATEVDGLYHGALYPNDVNVGVVRAFAIGK